VLCTHSINGGVECERNRPVLRTLVLSLVKAANTKLHTIALRKVVNR